MVHEITLTPEDVLVVKVSRHLHGLAESTIVVRPTDNIQSGTEVQFPGGYYNPLITDIFYSRDQYLNILDPKYNSREVWELPISQPIKALLLEPKHLQYFQSQVGK